MGQLEGRVAVVTGAGRGIGREIALRYAREGATVVVSSRTADDLEAVLGRIADDGGAPGHLVVADATDRDDARRPVTETLERYGRVDVLVNNVGGTVGRSHDPFTGDDESFEGTLVLSLTSGVVDESRRVAVDARARIRSHHQHRIRCVEGHRRFVGLHDGQTRIGRFHEATRRGDRRARDHGELSVPRLDEHVAGRLRAHRARDGCDGCRGRSARAANDALQRRVLEPEELAGMATLLAGDDGRGVTGQVISVDGGYRV